MFVAWPKSLSRLLEWQKVIMLLFSLLVFSHTISLSYFWVMISTSPIDPSPKLSKLPNACIEKDNCQEAMIIPIDPLEQI